jgi:protein-tyrosine-phosphatase
MNILFVCTGSINRSPAAAMLARHYDGVETRSRALSPNAPNGQPMTRKMREAVAEIMPDAPDVDDLEAWPRSQQITREDLEWADRLFYMQRSHLLRLEPFLAERINLGLPCELLLGDANVPDPQFGKVSHRSVAALIVAGLERLSL